MLVLTENCVVMYQKSVEFNRKYSKLSLIWCDMGQQLSLSNNLVPKGLSSLPPLVFGRKTLVAAGHRTPCETNISTGAVSTNDLSISTEVKERSSLATHLCANTLLKFFCPIASFKQAKWIIFIYTQHIEKYYSRWSIYYFKKKENCFDTFLVTRIKVHLTPKYFFCSNKSLHLLKTHCAFLPHFNPNLDFLQAVNVTIPLFKLRAECNATR